MIFNSAIFIAFAFVVVVLNYLMASRFRLPFLLFCSLVFVGYYNLESLATLLVFTVFNFYIAKRVAGNRLLYIVGLLLNAYAIVMFNYFSWSQKGPEFSYTFIHFNLDSFIIALGLSFYSLQNIAYLSEVYFERMKPEPSFLRFALYNAFFPKAISGPVMLPAAFLPQVNEHKITSEQLIAGFNRFLLGLFKKLVIADRLAPAVHSIFDFNDTYAGLTTVTGIYLFTLQLYFDFSGYSDMALGIAKMLGYDLKENFNMPLRSQSISEFWRKWHISLISWFSNYIYYPVVYRLRKYKQVAAFVGIVLTFFVSGIWHGIGFTFLAWACCHAVYLSVELFTKKWTTTSVSESVYFKPLRIFWVFNLVALSNVFFRADSIATATRLLKNSVQHFMPADWLKEFVAPLAVGGHQMDEFNFYISLFVVAFFLMFEGKLNKLAVSQKWSIVYSVLLVLLLFLLGVFSNGERFIYMQF